MSSGAEQEEDMKIHSAAKTHSIVPMNCPNFNDGGSTSSRSPGLFGVYLFIDVATVRGNNWYCMM
jgi:hypothetical protein